MHMLVGWHRRRLNPGKFFDIPQCKTNTPESTNLLGVNVVIDLGGTVKGFHISNLFL